MGKPRKGNNPSKNIFKVAGSRTFKAKNKTKPVTTQLKKLNEVVKQKTEEVDRQMNLLQEEVRQSNTKKAGADKKNAQVSRLIPKDVKKYEECEKKSAEALEKLLDMSV